MRVGIPPISPVCISRFHSFTSRKPSGSGARVHNRNNVSCIRIDQHIRTSGWCMVLGVPHRNAHRIAVHEDRGHACVRHSFLGRRQDRIKIRRWLVRRQRFELRGLQLIPRSGYLVDHALRSLSQRITNAVNANIRRKAESVYRPRVWCRSRLSFFQGLRQLTVNNFLRPPEHQSGNGQDQEEYRRCGYDIAARFPSEQAQMKLMNFHHEVVACCLITQHCSSVT